MTTQDGKPKTYLNHETGVWSWISTLDHKRIGVMYLVGVCFAFLLGGIFAILLRTEHLTTGAASASANADPGTVMSPDFYNQAFTLHGAIMVFLFIIPGIPAAMGNFILPIMLGTIDVAFPRLNLMSFYLWCIGAVFFLLALAMGGLDTGWTFYTPYATTTVFGGVVPAVFGAFVLGFSSILTAVNFIATVHMLRHKDMSWFRMPLFIWALYSTAVIQVLATPVLAITLLLLIAERVLHIGIFDPALGGDPVLFQHFFWFYSHPAVYIMILPAMGVVSELIGTYCHKHVFGYKFIAFSSIAIALLGFLVWGHHMFVSGQSELASIIFSVITFSIAIPSAVKIFNWLATMYKSAMDLTTPMLYGLSFIWVFSIGGLTGLPLATAATDVHLHDTYFVVAHFHYVMVGGMVFAFLGAIQHWWPKMFGKMANEMWSKIAWLLVFWGFNQTFFVQFFMGLRGMPRRYYSYAPEFQLEHQISTIGSYIMGLGLVMLAVVLIQSLMRGAKAPANPWGGSTLEWQAPSPPPLANFDAKPFVGDPYDYQAVEYHDNLGGYVLNPAKAGRGEH